ncbi:MAG: SLC13 family permease, partial [Dehalococcoidia bacterium]|nr:SLC13 family permease [Dehalococcoidia bacterium]
DFMLNTAPVALISMGVLFVALYVWFRNRVTAAPENRVAILARDANSAITDKRLLIKSGIVFGFTVVGFLVHELLHVGPAYIAVTAAAVLVLISRIDPHEVLEQVEWTTLAFFTGLFVLVGGLEYTGVTVEIREWLIDASGGSDRNLAFLLIWFGGLSSAIIDNVPFTATMVEVVKGFSDDGSGISPLWWALALGADLGGNATIVGASANVIVVNLARAGGYPISFVQFLRYGAVISVLTLIVSTAYVWLRYF